MGYKLSAGIDTALQNLAASYPNTCSQFTLNQPSRENNQVTAVQISAAAPGDATPVLFTGGIHARELAPPDALLSFCAKLLDSYANSTDVVYPAFTDTTGTVYDEYTVDASTVTSILQNFSLFVVPCANPDGRNYVLSSKQNALWRKNRFPDPNCTVTGPLGSGPGVDINRNFPFVWDADTYYAPSVVPNVGSSKTPCDENFRGYDPPEPETQNLIDLVSAQTIEYLVDVHMQGRKVYYPWGMDTDQSTDATQTFSNTAYDRQRDGIFANAYGEYMPNNDVDTRPNLLDRLVSLANAMVAEIINSAGSDPTAIARSTYTAQQSSKLYMTTGAFDDFVFGQQFLNTNLPDTCAFTLECGLKAGSRRNDPGDGEWGFWPDFVTQYPKVEREVHAALFGLLNAI
jgi:hypothetical protein